MAGPQVRLDRVDNLDAVERLGVVRVLNRKARLIWAVGDVTIPQDYSVLMRALEAAGLPAMFSTLSEAKCNALVLVERQLTLAEQTTGCVDVSLRYEHLLDGPNQKVFLKADEELGARTVLYGKNKTSIVQKPTNFFKVKGVTPDASLAFSPATAVLGSATITYASRGNELGVGTLEAVTVNSLAWTQPGETLAGPAVSFPAGTTTQRLHARLDQNAYLDVRGTPNFTVGTQAVTLSASQPVDQRVQIEVAHTFTTPDNDVSGLRLLPNLPNTVVQGGEVQVSFPQANYRLEGYAYLDAGVTPQDKAYGLVAGINSKPMLGRDPLTWICSEVAWEVLDPAQNLFRFGFEFQNDTDTWNPDVVFHDQRTGRPPATLLKAQYADGSGVLRLAHNPYTGADQPAGYWKVPFLREVDFEAEFLAELR